MSKQFKKLFFLIFLFSNFALSQVVEVRDTILMGSRFKITIEEENTASANLKIDRIISEIVRIENLISDWIPNSQVSRINENAGIKPVKVDKEVFDLTKRAVYFSEISNGAFDISVAALEKVYDYKEGWMDEFPDEKIIQKSISKVGYQNIILDEKNQTVFLKFKGMKIGFGSTGKGYAAQKARSFAQAIGVQSGIIDASGDISTWSSNSNWKIGIHNPFRPKNPIDILKLKNAAVTTSGNYEKFLMIGGKRYSHIINPKTGIPAEGLTSVTVLGPDAEFANGLSTTMMVLGKKNGLRFIQNFPDYASLMITDEGKVIRSKNYRKLKKSLAR